MRRLMVALAGFYRKWRYVEDEAVVATPASAGAAAGEADRLRLAIEREERLLNDYRRNGCTALARERESTLRSLKNRLAARDLAPRRAV